MAGAARGATRRALRSPVAVMTVGLFLEFTCWKLMAPLLPLWASRLGATPVMVGLLITVFAAAELGCAPLLGRISDRFGRKPVIVIALGLSVVFFVMVALARSVAMLLVAQAVGGFSIAVVSVGQAFVADRAEPARLTHTMAGLTAAIGIGQAVGPALGGALSALSPTAPFWAAAVLACVNTAIAWALLPETRGRGDGVRTSAPRIRWRELVRSRGIPRLALTTLIFGSVVVTLEAVLPLFTRRVLGWAEAGNGWLFAYLGVVTVAAQLLIVGRSVGRFGERRLLAGGLGIAALGLVLLGTGTTAAPVLAGVGLVGVGTGLIIPLLPALFCFASPAGNRGAVLGFAQGLVALARLIAPVTAAAAFTWSVTAPFVLAGALCLLGAVLVSVGHRPVIAAGPEVVEGDG